MILGAIAKGTGIHPFLSGSAVSLLALLGAVVGIARLARDEGFDPRWSLAALLLFPKAMFFVAVYTEALFLLCSAGCLLALRRRRLAAAALWGALADSRGRRAWSSRSRFSGPGSSGGRGGERGRKSCITGRRRSLPVAGAGCFGLYLWSRFGSPSSAYARRRPAGASPPGVALDSGRRRFPHARPLLAFSDVPLRLRRRERRCCSGAACAPRRSASPAP